MLHSKLKNLLAAAVIMILSVILAQVVKAIPMTPVPLSALLIAVFLAGALLNRKTALLSLAAYVLFGLLGAPIFPQFTGGLHALAGPTGGFILSYPLVAVLIACMAEKWGRGFAKYLLYMMLSSLVSYGIGTAQLLAITKAGLGVGLEMAVTPFLLPHFLMCLLAAVAAAAYDRIFRRRPFSPHEERVSG